MTENTTLLPRNDICVLDKSNLSEENTIFYYKSQLKFFVKYHFEDEKNKELYKCEYKLLSGGKCTYNDPKTDRPLFEIRNKFHLTSPNEIIITSIKNDKEIGTVSCTYKPKVSLTRYIYTIEFYNKSTEKKEILEVDCSGNYKNCTIYYGLKKEKGIPICHYNNLKGFFGTELKIEISPRVDTLFILIIIEQVFHLIQGRKTAAAA